MKHHVLNGAHPSPLAGNKFQGQLVHGQSVYAQPVHRLQALLVGQDMPQNARHQEGPHGTRWRTAGRSVAALLLCCRRLQLSFPCIFQPRAMQSDDVCSPRLSRLLSCALQVIWNVIRNGHCSFRVKSVLLTPPRGSRCLQDGDNALLPQLVQRHWCYNSSCM